MSSNTTPSVTDSSSVDNTAPQAASPAPTGAVPVNANATISNMSDFQAQAPAVYQAMLQGIATTICNQMEQNQATLKQMQDEEMQEAEG